jgi:hypothetical protein
MRKICVVWIASAILLMQCRPLFGSICFSDDFSGSAYDPGKWDLDVSGSASFAIESQQAKFTIKNHHAFLKSKSIDIGGWDTIEISGQWRILSAKTPEYTITIYDADNETNWLNVTYKSWDDILGSGGSNPALWIRDSARPSPYTMDIFYRTPPTEMTNFSIELTKTGWTFTEGGQSWTYNSTTLADASSFKVRIGGWDASSLSGQIVYFDNIEVSAIPEPATIIIIALGVPLLHGRGVKNKHA